MLQEFKYISPETSDELFDVLAKQGDNAKIIAGGTDLLVNMRAQTVTADIVIDIKKLKELKEIKFDDNEGLSIGAAVTCMELIENEIINKHFHFLKEAALEIGSPQLRNRATIAGNICTASPCGDMSRALICMDALVEIGSGNGERIVKLTEFFKGVKKTVLDSDEVVLRIIVPPEMADVKGGHEKLKRIKGHDLAVASVSLIKKDKIMKLSIGSCAMTPVLLPDMDVDTPVKQVLEIAQKYIKPIDDIRASAEYRIFMVNKYIERLMDRIK